MEFNTSRGTIFLHRTIKVKGGFKMLEELEPIVREVRALEDYKLYLKFNNGEEKIYDVKPLLNKKNYQGLKEKERFKKVKIDGISIEWETGEDVAPENLYYDSVPLEKIN